MEEFDNDSILKIINEAGKFRNGISSKTDSLRYNNVDKLLSHTISEMDKRIEILNHLESDMDDKYKLKENVLSFLITQKEVSQYIFGIYRKILYNGEKSITKSEEAETEKYLEKQKKLQSERERIENLFLHYQIHYEITVNELEKYGL